jgi:hypothetical protein
LNITQLQIAFNAEQDRLLFRISGADGNEMRAWLARRLVKQLWPKLLQLLSHKVAQEVPAATIDARRMVLGMRHEAAVGQADFSQSYRASATQFPLGEEPFVASKLSMSALANGSYLLAMHPADGRGVELRLNDTLLHGWCRMLQKACREAEWDLVLDFPGPAPVDEKAITTRMLN